MLNYCRLLSAASALLAVCLVLPTAARAGSHADLTLRSFCQDFDGYGVYFPVVADGFPANGTGTITYDVPQVEGLFFEFPFETDAFGSGEHSIGFGLSGVDDPLLGDGIVVVTVSVGGTSATETVSTTCDPAANAPADRAECRDGIFRNFFAFVGYTYTNHGDCVAYVSTHGRNELRAPPVSP